MIFFNVAEFKKAASVAKVTSAKLTNPIEGKGQIILI